MVRALVLGLSMACAPRAGPAARTANAATPAEAEPIRETERARLRALVDADVDALRRLHADDFQVVNPLGGVSSRERYLESVASGSTDYVDWPVDSMSVRLYERSAVIRYWSHVDLTVRGVRQPRQAAWNTAVYERRDGRWQIVWFQVTYVR